ncbi:MAG: PEP-CTERM sorting domain-containing protein [Chthoniobacterales bacterium]
MSSLRIRSFIFGVTALAVVAIVRLADADTILYGSTGGTDGRLYQIDVTTQIVTFIGSTGFERIGGIAFNANGLLYGVSGGSASQGTLLTINLTNGAATVIGLLSDPNAAVDGLRFNSQGVLYGSSFNNNTGAGQLLTIDPSNANVLSSLTLSGSGNSYCAGIAFDALDVLYGSRGNASGRAEDLDLIQPNGTLTPIGGMEAVISDIVFSGDGTLYGGSPTGDLYSINAITGAKTLLFNTGIANFAGLAAPVPEPSTSILFVLAIFVLFVLIRRHARRQPFA